MTEAAPNAAAPLRILHLEDDLAESELRSCAAVDHFAYALLIYHRERRMPAGE
jgi:hypothetical protein